MISDPSGLRPEELQELIRIVIEFFGSRTKAGVWWITPNPMFGNVSPNFMFTHGRGRKLYDYVHLQQFLSTR